MSHHNLMGVGRTTLEAQEDLANRIEVARGMGLVVVETQVFVFGDIHQACARMCSKKLKKTLDRIGSTWYTGLVQKS